MEIVCPEQSSGFMGWWNALNDMRLTASEEASKEAGERLWSGASKAGGLVGSGQPGFHDSARS